MSFPEDSGAKVDGLTQTTACQVASRLAVPRVSAKTMVRANGLRQMWAPIRVAVKEEGPECGLNR